MIEELTEQELNKLWFDMGFTQDYLINKTVYRKLRTNYSILIENYNTLNKGIDELLKKYENKIVLYTESGILVKEIIQDIKSLKGSD